MASRDELTLDGELMPLFGADSFEPFAICLTSGERFELHAPDPIIGQNVVTILRRGAGSIIIRRNQIVAIDATIGSSL